MDASARPHPTAIVLLITLFLFFLCSGLSLFYGAFPVSSDTVLASFHSFDANNLQHQLIQEVRLPRLICAGLVGIALALSGTMMQGLTRNALADPSLLGITHGAGLGVAISLAFVSAHSFFSSLMFSFGGAALGTGLIVLITVFARGRFSPVTLTVAGAALSALFGALSTGITLFHQVAQDLSFWYAGGLSGSKWEHVHVLLPIVLIGTAISLHIARSMTVLSLGEEVAAGLGSSLTKVRVLGFCSIVLLAGSAVSIAGVIGFVGLVIPHISRFLVGTNYYLLLPVSALFGMTLLIVSDLLARMVNPPFETPLGAITAVIGVPYFLYLARRKELAI
ncbi:MULTISPECIES: iron ABC transporter permease [unclassified Exiguobacterium]|uniref:FecCD family ABC transporter permease n=1 Tax=unclassified Exiguobacterium TaxID=2644629 RepID=UPI001BEC7C81|nr:MULTISPECIES: iron ABC transporter permease [unclassified Exiguobacterium]